MAYTKQNWIRGDVITAEKLNHMEDGIASGGGGGGGVEVAIKGTVEYDNTLSLNKVTFDKSIDEILAMYNAVYDSGGGVLGVSIDYDGVTRYCNIDGAFGNPSGGVIFFGNAILFRQISDPTLPTGNAISFDSSVDRTVPLAVYMDTLMSPFWTGEGGRAELYTPTSGSGDIALIDTNSGDPISAGALALAMGSAHCDVRVRDGGVFPAVCGVNVQSGSGMFDSYVSKLSIMTAEATNDATTPIITIKTFTASSVTSRLALAYTSTLGGTSGGSES